MASAEAGDRFRTQRTPLPCPLPPDYLIVGSGIAALQAALALARSGEVLLLTKAASAEGNTGYAQGGIAAAVGDDDDPELHEKDTLAAGDGALRRPRRAASWPGARPTSTS